MGTGGVVEPSGGGFSAGHAPGHAGDGAEAVDEIAHGKNLGASDVNGHGGRTGEFERLDAVGDGVGLPDDVDVAHRDVDGLVGEDALSNVDQQAVAELDGVVEANQCDRVALLCRRGRKDFLAG